MRRFASVILAAAAIGAVAGCEKAREGPASVLLVTLDTTRADRLGAYGGPAAATPNLDALAARGLRFERAFAVAPLTLPAHASILTGLLPPATGVRVNGEHRLDPAGATLATRFRDAGAATGAFVSAAVLDPAFGLDRGFDRYDAEVGTARGPFRAERAAAATVARALAWIGEQPESRRVFVWVHLFEPHDPYEPPAAFAARFPGDPYIAEIAAVDDALAPLLAHPRFRPEARAIVAAVGDHGESLGEKGEATHGVLVHDAVLRVPWLLAAPGLAPAAVTEDVSQVDLAPTLLALAGLPALAGADGRSLVAGGAVQVSGRALYAESLYGSGAYGWAPLFAARRDGWKLVRGGRDELFETRGDPAESRDRRADAPEKAAALGRELETFAARERAGVSAALDAELAARVASLGYVGGADAAPRGDGPREASDPRDRIAVHEQLRAVEHALAAGRTEAVHAGLREVLAADPGNALALRAATAAAEPVVRRAATALAARRFVEAEAAAREALALTPRDAPARNVLAIALEETGRLAEAEREYEAILAANPGYLRAELNLALLHARRGDTARAEAGLARVLAVSPNDPLALWNLARLALERGDRAAAGERLREFLAAAPADRHAPEARRLLAEID